MESDAQVHEPVRLIQGESSKSEPGIFVSLTYDALNSQTQLDRVKSPKAGAVVLFAGMTSCPFEPTFFDTIAGCTRDSFDDKPVTHLAYSSYPPLALKTLLSIAQSMLSKHGLTSIAITHRLGRVEIGEESILIAMSSPHRQAAWKAGEECLELVKEKVEIWKEEWFADGGVWRANRDGHAGVPV